MKDAPARPLELAPLFELPSVQRVMHVNIAINRRPTPTPWDIQMRAEITYRNRVRGRHPQ